TSKPSLCINYLFKYNASMQDKIILSPSDDTNKLFNTIVEATRDNQLLILKAGIHLTRPGKKLVIPIGKNGLHIKGFSITPTHGLPFQAKVQRPDNAIDPRSTDDNYGLFFIPDKPDEREWINIKTWKTHTKVDTNGKTTSFQYAVI